MELVTDLNDELVPLSLDLGQGQVDRPRVPQLLHLAPELGLLHRKPSELRNDGPGLKTDVVDEDPTEEVQSEAPAS